MLVEGVYLAIIASVVTSVGGVPVGALLGGLGFLSAFFGFLTCLFAALLFMAPESHVGYGIGILVVSLLSLLGGGGFLVGLILGAVGGILAIVFVPLDEMIKPQFYPSISSTHDWMQWGTCAQCGAPIAAGDARCPRCGRPAAAPGPVVEPGAAALPANPIPREGPATAPARVADAKGRTLNACPSCVKVVPIQASSCPHCGHRWA